MISAPTWATRLLLAYANPELDYRVEVPEIHTARRVGMLPCGELPPSRSADRHRARNASAAVSWALPGHGEALDDCGEPYYVGCLATDAPAHHGKAYISRRAHNCGRRECPKCEGTGPDAPHGWSVKIGRKAGHRMARGVAANGEGRAVHVVLSPPQDRAVGLEGTVGGSRRMRAAAIAVAKAAGYLGGLLIFHPWRCRDDGGKRLPGWYLQLGAQAIDGPHFHLETTGWNEGIEALFDATGWIVHRCAWTDREGVYHGAVLEDEDAMVGCAVYALTHAGVGTWRDPESVDHSLETLTWWGSFATSVLKLEPEPEADFEDTCPLCGALLAKLVWLGELPGPPDGLVDPDMVALDFQGWLEDVRSDSRRHAPREAREEWANYPRSRNEEGWGA